MCRGGRGGGRHGSGGSGGFGQYGGSHFQRLCRRRAAGAASVPAAYAMGVSYAVIPAGCATPSVGGSTYYLCGNTWFKPMYGANGVYYRVVPTP